MRNPEIVEVTATCPECGRTAELEVIVVPFQRVRGRKDQIHKTSTWANCPGCGHEWQLDGSVARDARLVA